MDLFDGSAKKIDGESSAKVADPDYKNVGGLVPTGSPVSRYEIRPLSRHNVPSYEKLRSTFNPETKKAMSQFHISEHVRSQLSVEEEETKRFHAEVERVANEKLQVIKDEATKQAKEDGYREGSERGYQERAAELDIQLTFLTSLVEDLVTSKRLLSEKYQKELTNLALKIGSILLHYEIKNAPEMIHHSIAQMMDHVSKSDDVIIRISKSYSDYVDSIRTQLSKFAGNEERRIQIELSEELAPGNAIVECFSGEVASFIEDKINLLKESLFASMESSKEKA